MTLAISRFLKPFFFSLVVATMVMFVPMAANAQATTTAQSRHASSNIMVQGATTDATGAAGTFSGILQITKFVVQNGQVVAQGLLNGTVTTTATGAVTQVTNQAISAVVSSASASCPILTLTLGPLHLNLLGLTIDLNQINLSIAAQPGAGNLLGNLLCDVANLLNNGGALSSLVGQLNALLGAL